MLAIAEMPAHATGKVCQLRKGFNCSEHAECRFGNVNRVPSLLYGLLARSSDAEFAHAGLQRGAFQAEFCGGAVGSS